MKNLFPLLVMICLASCKQAKKPEIFAIISEKDLVPEGTAYDENSETLFISSTYYCKVLAINKEGTIRDFIGEQQDGIWSAIGMEVDASRPHLWVISSNAPDVLPTHRHIKARAWQSAAYEYKLPEGQLIHRYALELENDSLQFFFNDLTVSQSGKVFITESMQNKIYILDPDKQKISLFLAPQNANFLNGITFDEDDRTLFVAATEGILAINPNNGDYHWLELAPNINAGGIDGLAYCGGYLIGHQSKTVSRFFLDATHKEIVSSEILDDQQLDSSTTGEIGKGYYYYIANSQIQSAIDYEQQRIKPLDSLEQVVIKRIRL